MTARKPFEFPRDKSEPDLEDVPESMKYDAGLVTENLGPDDIVWLAPGADGELEVRLPKQGFEQYSPFDLVLLAIIRANLKGGKRNTREANEHERLRDAKRALFGAPELDSAYSRTTRATTRDDFDRARNLRIIDEIFERLESLAVKVSRKGVPRMQREDDELAPRADET